MSIHENFDKLRNKIPEKVELIPVSKTKPKEDILNLYQHGCKCFGENRARELQDKYNDLPKDIEWHMIGHLQTNKVKYIAPFVKLIHSVDREKLLRAINKEAKKNGRIIDCLLQFHIAKEETKFGFDINEAKMMLNKDFFSNFENVKIRGVMGMATFTENKDTVRDEFRGLKEYFDMLKDSYFSNDDDFSILSMGMTNDYKIAVEEGANMLRIGSLIFGKRN